MERFLVIGLLAASTATTIMGTVFVLGGDTDRATLHFTIATLTFMRAKL